MRFVIVLKYIFYIHALFIMAYIVINQYRKMETFTTVDAHIVCSANYCVNQNSQNISIENHKKIIRVVWYAPPRFVKNRPTAMFSGFNGCPYSNCKMSYIQSDAASSDAVIFTGQYFPTKMPFTRPFGQIWIFSEHEPPYRYREMNNAMNERKAFNWTMTYDKSVSDIHLPYGQIMNKTDYNGLKINEILKQKTRTALIVMSHCDTPSNRLLYLKELKKYIEVDIFGECGDKWNCGERFLHDNCFSIINQYKFYLAFENSFCSNYFTEKVFENFDYDSVLVVRGGKYKQANHFLPEGTFISADDFKNARELGTFLKSMPDAIYVNILKRKQLFTSVKSYQMVFHKAMCNICYRMNNLNTYKKQINNMFQWAYNSNPCVAATDLIHG